MRTLDLFSGIGGFALAARWMGWDTVAFIEINPFCQKVLAKNFPSVPVYDDIKLFDYEQEKEKIGSIDLICGGFPCQPFSVAGKRLGNEDERALWSEMFRLIQQVQPAWVVGENVANFVNMGLDAACADLENAGYAVQPFIIPACAVNACHRRDRVWILAHSGGNGLERISEKSFSGVGEYHGKDERQTEEICERPDFFEPKLLRTLNGVSNGVDRLRGLGNAVVPQLVCELFKAINSYKTT